MDEHVFDDMNLTDDQVYQYLAAQLPRWGMAGRDTWLGTDEDPVPFTVDMSPEAVFHQIDALEAQIAELKRKIAL